MPFESGETVRLHYSSETPDSVVLEFLGQRYTLANGLELKRKGRLIAEVRLPRDRGKYPYKWTDGEQIVTGHLRVQGGQRAKPAQARETQAAEPQGAKVRRVA